MAKKSKKDDNDPLNFGEDWFKDTDLMDTDESTVYAQDIGRSGNKKEAGKSKRAKSKR